MTRRVVRKGPSRIVENTWTCSACRATNLGRHMTCQSCGEPKDRHEKYELPSHRPTVTNSEQLKQARAGANWTCSYCQWDNRDLSRKTCEQCGAPRKEAMHDPNPSNAISLDNPPPVMEIPPPPPAEPTGYRTSPTREDLLRRKEKLKKMADEAVPAPPVHLYVGGRPIDEPRNPGRAGAVALGGAIFAACIAFVMFFVWLCVPHEEDTFVQSTTWRYTRTLEERTVQHGSGWGHPIDAFNVHCERRQHGTENCHPHDCDCRQVSYDCRCHDCNCVTHESCSDLGNGYSSCHEEESCSTCCDTCSEERCSTCYDQCPVYDDWCTYDYYQWIVRDTETTSGTGRETQWGTRLHGSPPNWRILQAESYQVVFVEEQDTWTYSPRSLAEYQQFEPHEEWIIKVNHAGQVWPQHEVHPQ
jgi:hypothetical protein